MIMRRDILFSHPAHFLALGLGAGLSPLGPGTVGTVWAFFNAPANGGCVDRLIFCGLVGVHGDG